MQGAIIVLSEDTKIMKRQERNFKSLRMTSGAAPSRSSRGVGERDTMLLKTWETTIRGESHKWESTYQSTRRVGIDFLWKKTTPSDD